MENGILKLEEASFLVEKMKETLATMEEELEKASKMAEQVKFVNFSGVYD